jgi:hypothetical protein
VVSIETFVTSLTIMPIHLLAGCLLLILALANHAYASSTADHVPVHAVVESFRTAILDKDRARFLSLFAPGPVTWQSVRGDAALHQLRKQQPQAAKVEFARDRTPASFIDGIVANPVRIKEMFGNVRIDSDHDVASVVFDDRFLRDGRESNRGLEIWHLVRTESGWRIVSVVWSVNPPPAGEDG